MGAETQANFRLSGIDKSYEHQRVLSALSLELGAGDLALLLGANGAGKTTLLRICAGLSRPDSGTVCAGNGKKPADLAGEIGYAGHNLNLYASFTVEESVELSCTLRGIAADVASCLDVWELGDVRNKTVGDLSRGLQFRTALCCALVHSPRFIFLDETTSCLDDRAVEILLELLKRGLSQGQDGRFALIATHDTSRLAGNVNRIVILNEGRISHDVRCKDEAARSAILAVYARLNR